MEDLWEGYRGRQVRLIVEDVSTNKFGETTNFPKPKDGIFIDIDRTHIFLKIVGKTGRSTIVPFSRDSVKRVELREDEDG